ncbi:MAG: arsenical pump-driving ATPase [Actinomycetota bacterium]|nr:arsenical pump-driving ATPase [Actinomycetota bacterium]
MGLLASTARFVFFTGKGGVGKTSTAAASAVALADRGARVLLVSTDPASNLDEVLDTALGAVPTLIKGVPGLDAMNIDPVAAAATYRERVVGPYRGLLPASAVASIEEQLSGACTVEIAAFDEFTALLANPAATEAYDRVLFDTAPTGHTLRLLSLPEAWSSFIDTNTLGTSCIGPLSGLSAQQDRYRVALHTLADPDRTLLVVVARPDPLSLAEAARAAGELGALGVRNQRLVVNGVFQASDPGDPLATSLAASSAAAVAALPGLLADLERDEVPLVPWSLVGTGGLRALVGGSIPPGTPEPPVALPQTAAFGDLIDELESRGRGLVLTMGKGGVGKTTIAAAVALELARRGCEVELTTTDPAAHLDAVLASDEASIPGQLQMSRVDPEAVTAAYRAEVLAGAGAGLDDGARAVLEEDLRSPCTEEIAVFGAFARTVAAATERFVVLDTAPTGHTLLLLDAARAYHREVGRQGGSVPLEVEALLARLADPSYTSVLVVTLPEATPVHEAGALQADLRRAGIEPAAWVVNQSLAASAVSDPVLAARAAAERSVIGEIATSYASRLVLLPMLPEAPTGPGGLSRLVNQPAISTVSR